MRSIKIFLPVLAVCLIGTGRADGAGLARKSYNSLMKVGRAAYVSENYEKSSRYYKAAAGKKKTGKAFYYYLMSEYELGNYARVAKTADRLLGTDMKLGEYKAKIRSLRKRAKAKKKGSSDDGKIFLYSAAGAAGFGALGVILGYKYKGDADTEFENYSKAVWNSEQEEQDSEDLVIDLDTKSATWYTVGAVGIAAGVAVLLYYQMTYKSKRSASAAQERSWAFAFLPGKRGGGVTFLKRF